MDSLNDLYYDVDCDDCWACGRMVPVGTLETIRDCYGTEARVCETCVGDTTPEQIVHLKQAQLYQEIGALKYELRSAEWALRSGSETVHAAAVRRINKVLEQKP